MHEFQRLPQTSNGANSRQTGRVNPACETCAAYSAMGRGLWTPPLIVLDEQGALRRVAIRVLSCAGSDRT